MSEKYEVLAKLLDTVFQPADSQLGDAFAFQMLIEGEELNVCVTKVSGKMLSRHAVLALQSALYWMARTTGATVGDVRVPTTEELAKHIKDLQ